MSAAGNWCLIESDPGVFTELIRGFGVTGAQVEELYALDEDSFKQLKPVHGLIFLFKWIGNSDIDGELVKDSRADNIIFCKQVIENACATQAILSVLLNCNHSDIDIGPKLKELVSFIGCFDPETKGLALSNSDMIREVHNSFARQQVYELDEKAPSKAEDAFHFIAYLPINGRLYELDGLKEAPIDHGEIKEGVDWTSVVQPVLERRMQKYSQGEIQFNLMAVVSDRKMMYERELEILQEAGMEADGLNFRISELKSLIEDEERKRLSYKQENVRRKFNYLPMIMELLKTIANEGKLVEAIENNTERRKMKARKTR